MSYTIDKDLQAGMQLLEEGKNIEQGLKLINASARRGTTQGKSFFEIGHLIREGLPEMEGDAEEARRYFDFAMTCFERNPQDSMDYREMGDYFYYGLGTQPADKFRALEFYDLAGAQGDEEANQKALEIRSTLEKGDSYSGPTLSPETERAEIAPLSEEQAPVVENDKISVEYKDKVVLEEIDADQLLVKAVHLLDEKDSTANEREDGVEMVKSAADSGSLRASVLVGYLFEGDNTVVERDLLKAKEYYEKAIDAGSSSALFRLGVLYTDSETPFFDLEKGHELIVASAHAGYPFALDFLGDCFRNKVDDVRNLEVAYRYYALAGERGLGVAFAKMAEIDASRQQLPLALKHLKLATDNGYDAKLGYQDPLFYSLPL